jgi:hypothetical protein
MPVKPIELPPAVARRLVEDMRAIHAEPNAMLDRIYRGAVREPK